MLNVGVFGASRPGVVHITGWWQFWMLRTTYPKAQLDLVLSTLRCVVPCFAYYADADADEIGPTLFSAYVYHNFRSPSESIYFEPNSEPSGCCEQKNRVHECSIAWSKFEIAKKSGRRRITMK